MALTRTTSAARATLRDNYLRYQIGRIASLGDRLHFRGPAKGKASDFDHQP
jgi:hypothetical protein